MKSTANDKRGNVEIEMRKIVYVAGPYHGDTERNIANAERKSIELIRAGFAVFTPHKNTAGYEQYEDSEITWQTWIDIDLAILACCDILYVLKNSEHSKGTQREIQFATEHNMEIVFEAE